MTTSNKTILLVALSEGFAFPRVFAEKMDRIIGNLGDAEVVVVQDTRSIAQNYCDERGLTTRAERVNSRMAAKSVVTACTHVVVFWGGTDLADIIYFSRLLQRHLRIVPLRITTVRNKKNNEEFDVYIGRGTRWGNPYEIGRGPEGLSREEVIQRYKEHFETEILPDPERRSAVLALRGYRLGCFCAPLPCHGDVIAAYLNEYVDQEEVAGDSGTE
ncbi:DUF4326 domain-containing protein [Caballeronia cordobensis]|uniref:DUF4326 domain-containing protein n=1 Tax=Caballeronia cordobensis TaxID=1353886 RepID=UPI00045F08E4|nr:putative membrane protein [Burkholderia sp. RPE67]